MSDELDRLRAENERLCDELRRLRWAAEPFARLLPVCAGHHDRWPLTDAWDESTDLIDLDCGHVRRLAALLAARPAAAKEGTP